MGVKSQERVIGETEHTHKINKQKGNSKKRRSGQKRKGEKKEEEKKRVGRGRDEEGALTVIIIRHFSLRHDRERDVCCSFGA